MLRNYVLIFIFSILFLPTLIISIPEFDENNTITENQNQLDTTQLRLPFIENQGQIPSEYKYYAKTFAGTVYVTDSDLTYHSIKNENDISQALVIKEKFVGNSLNPHGKEKSESVVNYFKGTQDNWKTNIPTYNYVSLGQIWNNVDVDLKAHGNNMEKIFTIHPGGDPSDIQMSFDGISNIVLAENELKIGTELGDVFLSKPIAYQVIDGKKYDIPVSYDVLDSTTYGFSVLSYDTRFDLVIDPLIASTFVGGSNEDVALYDLVRDSSGNVYITGSTKSTDYPIASGYDSSHNGDYDVFVSKLNSNLSSLSASTFIGGTGYDESESIALDSSGNVYITGYTSSIHYPIVSGYDSSHNGDYDVFVSKLNSNLSSLSASTFIGGTTLDLAWDMTLDSSGNVYITGQTNSTNYPIASGYDSSFNGVNDVFVSKLNSNLSSLSASTFIGGNMSDYSYALVLDSSGNVYITGSTKSTDYPIASGYDSSHNAGEDAFVSKLNSNLSNLTASTFIGGSVDDASLAIALDSSGNVYITGATNSTDYPAANGYDSSYNAGDDAFVSKLNSNLSSLFNSTFIGGSVSDVSEAIALDSFGNVYITGETNSTDYPAANGYDSSHNGQPDVFVSKLNSILSNLTASTFIGHNAFEYSTAIALDSSGNVYITGYTNSTDYPTVSGYDSSFNGVTDVFLSYFNCHLSPAGSACTTPVLTVSPTAAITDGATFTELDGVNGITTVVIGGTTYALVASLLDDGVQIINMTTPSSPTATTAITDGATFTLLDGARGITTVVIGGTTYAFVASFDDDGVQIINMTTPSSPIAVSPAIPIQTGGTYTYLNGAVGITTVVIGGTTYALVASYEDDGVQIINMTTPSIPANTNGATDGGTFTELDGATDITTVVIGGTTYALVASFLDDGVQIINISTPSSITATTNSITDGATFTELDGARGITTVVIGGNTYALVASYEDDGVQIINISTPSSPTATAAITDGVEGFTELDGPVGITTVVIGGKTYALVAAHLDDGVQIIDISTPSSPTPVDVIQNGVKGFTALNGAYGIPTVVIGGTTYALVTAYEDDGVQVIEFHTGGFTNTEVVAAGGESTVTLPQNTAGSTNTVVVDLPTGTGATISVSTTTSGTSDSRILFVGQILDIDITNPTTTSFTFQVRITFTDADLTAAGLSLSNVVMYRDANENGNFETNESLTTTITPSSAPGPYTATANVPANSKFSIGGVAGSVSVNAAAGIGATGHFLGLLPDNCDENGFGNGESLRIYEISYDKCDANQITILADSTCGPMKIQVGKENNMNVAGMSSEQPYLNDEKRMIILSSPITSDIVDFTVIAQDKRDEFYEKIYADQCTGTKQYSFTTGYTSEQTNAESLPEWIKNNAKWWADDEIDDNTFVNGIQYLVKNNIISVQKSLSTEDTPDNTSDGIPEWIKNNAKWWADDSIDDDTFVNGIQYLVNNGIIKVD